VWHPDAQNPRGGRWDPTGWKGPNPPNASWDPDGHWDVNKGKGEPVDHHAPDGTPITPGQAHPGNTQSPMDAVRSGLNDLWQSFKNYLRDHPYGPNSSPGPYVPPLIPTPVPLFP
jgi:hypothetical protein